MTTPLKAPAEWSALLVDAVSKPGIISEAYSTFWSYSVGNQFLALWQCMLRGIPPGPLNTFIGWKELGRFVQKGQKALVLCMPITLKAKKAVVAEREAKENTDDEPRAFTKFLYRANWFTLAQTDGKPYQPQELPTWSEERALSSLGIRRIPFNHPDGNCQGFASGLSVSVSPIAFMPHRTLFHELAHVILGHTTDADQVDAEHTPKSLKEVEAEAAALICCESLGLAGAEYSRGYIQHWLQDQVIPERSAHRIFRAADKILRCGRSHELPTEDSITPA